MKILHKDLKHGIIKIKADNSEDLWYLESIIEPDDLISGMTERKIKIGGADEKSKISRVNVFLKIKAEKINNDSMLRISGLIVDAPEDIPRGEYHTFSVEEGTVITIEKAQWSRYALKKLDEAVDDNSVNILIVAFDREEAIFARLKNNGHEILLDLKGDVAKKDFEEKKTNFYAEIVRQIEGYDSRNAYSNIIIASPAFWKEYLLKELKNDAIKKKITMANCSSIDGSVINEILKRPELKTVLQKDRSAKENALIDELLDGIRKDNAAYGLKQVADKINSGNVLVLLVSENLIRKSREEKTYFEIDRLMRDAELINADIKIISSDAVKKLDGISGIACILRWKENYG
ncbi:TPA: mRNA surveillance protein pelota [Candidatus Woesearchaeota archaeon]|nr:mRNA surveillance protein pelota [Candidatus Woesearchaeota archaeon]HIH31275.1 mRNA surveillance protein pelota [Candidatus Woesearchaeota archaeon]HIH54497.1 mRNA surveillance protein pelota [Candidatus Woesearchaeota archaeon]HIJ01998.1 mRNA surveillance protein pelota [Candidatus Woesearchaeota archaeon]